MPHHGGKPFILAAQDDRSMKAPPEATPTARVLMLTVSEECAIWLRRYAAAPAATCSRPWTATRWLRRFCAPWQVIPWSAPR
jgi:uncharacterized glyoxalase superfamily protein PhnB